MGLQNKITDFYHLTEEKEREKKGGKRKKWTERKKDRRTNLQANPTEIGFTQLRACHIVLYIQALTLQSGL